MDEKYFPEKIEENWQKRWLETRAFEPREDDPQPKFYALEMLPYPSGFLHMGHVRNYSIGDALAWYKRLRGFNVLHPIGWDSFGQPAEQAAIKRGIQPRDWTEENIAHMKEIEDGWPGKVLKRQRDWVGRSEGAFIDFKVKDHDERIRVFTTRIDTIFGATAIVLAAEHPMLPKLLESSFLTDQVMKFTDQVKESRAIKTEDAAEEEEKLGMNTGRLAINPFSGEFLPIWVAN